MELTNTAPATGLPDYVVTRSDGKVVPRGQDRVFANVYATRGSQLISSQLDGKTFAVGQGIERGLAVFEADVELPVGQPKTLTLTLSEPRTGGEFSYLVQPLAKPQTLVLQGGC